MEPHYKKQRSESAHGMDNDNAYWQAFEDDEALGKAGGARVVSQCLCGRS